MESKNEDERHKPEKEKIKLGARERQQDIGDARGARQGAVAATEGTLLLFRAQSLEN